MGNQSSLIMDEVQQAMKEDSNPMMQQLKQGDWVTPDLEAQLASNTVFAKGLQNPKCVAALQLMQTNPHEAEKRFKGDPDVDEFMKEFGKIMSGHFSALGEKQDEEARRTNVAPKPIQEIGPLHAKVLERQKQQTSGVIPPSPPLNEAENERIKEIVNDSELSAMLMDPKLQEILVECGDPIKFQMHMQNPETARKIDKLYKSGLV